MKEAIVHKGPKVVIVDSPIPEPNADQLLIRVVVSGSNPKDWKLAELTGRALNEGDDIAGVVVRVGAHVTEFRPGDRVAAFHEMLTPHGSYAEYAIAWQSTTFLLPPTTSFEEAATLPLAALTAVVGLYAVLALPQPWTPATAPTALIVYGASTAVGSFALQLAARSNIHPIFAVAGESAAHVEALIDRSRGDTVVDYRGGEAAAAAALRAAVGTHAVTHALDAVADHHSNYVVSQALQPAGQIASVLPWQEDARVPATVRHTTLSVGTVHKEPASNKDLGFVFARFLGRGLQEGWLRPQPHKVWPGGLDGIEDALRALKAGQAHAVKYVFRIADTKGVGKDVL